MSKRSARIFIITVLTITAVMAFSLICGELISGTQF